LLVALRAEEVNLALVRFLLSVGARVISLDAEVFIGITRAWLLEEVQKLEVLIHKILISWTPLHYYLLTFFQSAV
jgi:hypothetical protein